MPFLWESVSQPPLQPLVTQPLPALQPASPAAPQPRSPAVPRNRPMLNPGAKLPVPGDETGHRHLVLQVGRKAAETVTCTCCKK